MLVHGSNQEDKSIVANFLFLLTFYNAVIAITFNNLPSEHGMIRVTSAMHVLIFLLLSSEICVYNVVWCVGSRGLVVGWRGWRGGFLEMG